MLHQLIWAGAWVVGVSLVYCFYLWAKRKVGKRMDAIGQAILNAGMIFIGAYAAHSQSFVVFKVKLPTYLTAPIFIAICIVLSKVLIGLLSLSLTRGLLPNSINPVLDPVVNERIDEGLDYQDALAYTMTALVEEQTRYTLALLRYVSDSEQDFINEFIPLMIRIFDVQLNALGIPTEFIVDKPDVMQDRKAMSALSYDIFVQVASGARDFQERYWDTGVMVPLLLWDETYMVVMYSDRVIPPNILRHLVETWAILSELPIIKVKNLAVEYLKPHGIESLEKAKEVIEHLDNVQ